MIAEKAGAGLFPFPHIKDMKTASGAILLVCIYCLFEGVLAPKSAGKSPQKSLSKGPRGEANGRRRVGRGAGPEVATQGWTARLELLTNKVKESAHAYLESVQLPKALGNARGALEDMAKEYADMAKAKASTALEGAKRRIGTIDQTQVAIKQWVNDFSANLQKGVNAFSRKRGLDKGKKEVLDKLAASLSGKVEQGVRKLLEKGEEIRKGKAINWARSLIVYIDRESREILGRLRGLQYVKEVTQLAPSIGDTYEVRKFATSPVPGDPIVGVGTKGDKPVFARVKELQEIKGNAVVESLAGFKAPDGRTTYTPDAQPTKMKDGTVVATHTSSKRRKVIIMKIDEGAKVQAYPLSEVEKKVKVLPLSEIVEAVKTAKKESLASRRQQSEQTRAQFLKALSDENFGVLEPLPGLVARLELSFKEILKDYRPSFLMKALRAVGSRPIHKTSIPLFIRYFGTRELDGKFDFGSIASLKPVLLSHVKSFYSAKPERGLKQTAEVIKFIEDCPEASIVQALRSVMFDAPELRTSDPKSLDWLMYKLFRELYNGDLVSKYLVSTGRLAKVNPDLLEERLGPIWHSVKISILGKLLEDETDRYEADLALLVGKKSLFPNLRDVLNWDGSINKPHVVARFEVAIFPTLGSWLANVLRGYFVQAATEELYDNFVCRVTRDAGEPGFISQVEQLLCGLPNAAALVAQNAAGEKDRFAKRIKESDWPKSFCSDQKTIQECLEKMRAWAKKKAIAAVYTPTYTRDPILGECRTENFIRLGVLGAGGYGTVFRVQHKDLGEQFAMKKINSETLEKAPATARAEELLSRKPAGVHVAPIKCVAQTPKGGIRLLMDLFPNGSLQSKLSKGYVFSEIELRKIAAQLIEGITAVHRAGVVHLDFKPDNVLIDAKGNMAIADFGMAIELKPGETDNDCFGGTYVYRAPELFSSICTHSSDLWSVGVSLYLLKKRRFPYDYKDHVWRGVMSGVRPFPKTDDKELDEVIETLTKLDPKLRAEAARTELRALPYFKGIEWSDSKKSPRK